MLGVCCKQENTGLHDHINDSFPLLILSLLSNVRVTDHISLSDSLEIEKRPDVFPKGC